MDLLNNPWIVGIGGGVLSGLVVVYLTRLLFSRRDTREYVQKTHQANHEVLYAVRPGISEGVIPTNDVLRSLIAATGRKYGVEAKDMHDLEAVSSELVKEVMDSSFISAASKQEFCEKLAQIREDEPSGSKVDPPVALHRAATCIHRASRVIGRCCEYRVLPGVRNDAKGALAACGSSSPVVRKTHTCRSARRALYSWGGRALSQEIYATFGLTPTTTTTSVRDIASSSSASWEASLGC